MFSRDSTPGRFMPRGGLLLGHLDETMMGSTDARHHKRHGGAVACRVGCGCGQLVSIVSSRPEMAPMKGPGCWSQGRWPALGRMTWSVPRDPKASVARRVSAAEM